MRSNSSSVRTPCPSCGKTLAVADELAGRRVKCPGCQHIFRVAATPDDEPLAVVAADLGLPLWWDPPRAETALEAL